MLTRCYHHRSRAVDTPIYIFIFLMAFCLSGCSLLRQRETTHIQHDTITVHHRDSIHHRDIIYIREWMRGDTVYIDRFRDRYLYRDRWRDSILVQRDTTVIKRTQEVRVEKPLNGWQRFRIGAFWWILALAAVGWRKQLLWLIKKAAGLFG